MQKNMKTDYRNTVKEHEDRLQEYGEGTCRRTGKQELCEGKGRMAGRQEHCEGTGKKDR
jgi:hypothetical protein